MTDDNYRWNRELSDAVNGCTDEQRQEARDVCDALAEHPVLCAAIAVAVIVTTALASSVWPGPWWGM